MNQWWSWGLTVLGVTGLVLAGKKIWWSWLIGLLAQVFWIAYALTTKQYGFVGSALVYGTTYAINAHKWYNQQKVDRTLQ